MLLRMLHLFGLVGWLGAATGEVVLEVMLKRSRSAAEQRSLLRLHVVTDAFVEGPGLVLAAITGVLLLKRRGWLEAGVVWPTWFCWKIAAASTVVVTNTFALIFVAGRYRAALRVPESERPLDDSGVRVWAKLTLVTWIGIPCAIVALALAGLYAG
jgi:hypothetical protein